MPLPILKIDPAPVPGQPCEAPPRGPTLGMLALKVVLSLPSFLGAYVLTRLGGLDRPMLILCEVVLIALGCTIVLTRNFTVGAFGFVLGGAATCCVLYVALIFGVFGGHQ